MPRKKVKRGKTSPRKKTPKGSSRKGAGQQDARTGLRHLRSSDLPLVDAAQYAMAQLHSKRDPDDWDEFLRDVEQAVRPRLIRMVGSNNDGISLGAIQVATRLREALGKRQVATIGFGTKTLDALMTMEVAKLQADIVKAGEAAAGLTPDAWAVAMANMAPMLAKALSGGKGG